MEQKDNGRALAGQLETVEDSLGFLVLLMLSLLLSFSALVLQRRQLACAAAGEAEAAAAVPDPYPRRCGASALVVGALGYFFAQALEGWQAARGEDQNARASALRNLWAALFVLAAALIRLCDLSRSRSTSGAAAALSSGTAKHPACQAG